MPSDGRMTTDERRKYLKLVAPTCVRDDERARSRLHVSLDRVMGRGPPSSETEALDLFDMQTFGADCARAGLSVHS